MSVTFTNKHNLPDVFVQAVKLDTHITVGDISTTQLIDAPQIRYLKKRHDVVEDVMDRMWALFGTAVHHILDRAHIKDVDYSTLVTAAGILNSASENDNKLSEVSKLFDQFVATKKPGDVNDHILTERTLHYEMDGYTFSGTMDRFDTISGMLQDYKYTSVYAYVYPEVRKKWAAQQNIYAFLLREHGYTVKNCEIIGIFKDWSEAKKLGGGKDYPKTQIAMMPIQLFDHEKVRLYIKKRIELHKLADDGNVKDCNGTERWAEADKWAAEVPGGKRAIKLFASIPESQNWMEANASSYEGIKVNYRAGKNKRCEKYCPVKSHCPQWKKILNSK